ncbi:MAG: ATP phosphoribosyltransferase regulatory subunit [Alphaproteobacteria bacterium]|nr:ATP phosphoribosyltransferase regulatory subunit [Alphaproteobacteria bacterium]
MPTDLESVLLPAGLRDVLPPEAAHEAAVVEALIARFAAYGYERVRPPLVEFEDSLLAGTGAATAAQTFRLMDPVSQRMMGVRTDITVQVARVAASRLAKAPRPLRLSYAGAVLRVRGTTLMPERELRQVGVELIGSAAPAADAEVVVLAADALWAVGVAKLSIDLNLPRLVPILLEQVPVRDKDGLRHALDHKDAQRVTAAAGGSASLFRSLLAAAGPAAEALSALDALELPGQARQEVSRLKTVAALIAGAAPSLALTIDPVEHRGFEYQTGISFSIFVAGVRGELGRGGRYAAGAGEPATGFTLAMETVLRALPEAVAPKRVYLPAGTPAVVAERLRAEGWMALAALDPAADADGEARRLGCTHVCRDGRPVELK